MSGQPDYTSLVTRAEKAVKGVQDPALKSIAYQKVLDDMLESVDVRAPGKPRGGQVKGRVLGNGGRKPSSKAGPRGYVDELVSEGFFKNPRSIGQVKSELENRGHHIPSTSLSGPLQVLCQRKVLRRQKVTETNKKATFAYSEW